MTGASPRVAVVGTFDPSYSRNRILLAVLERAGISVDVTSFDLWGSDRHTIVNRPKLGLALRAAGIFPRLAWRLLRAPRPNAYLVLYPGQLDMPLVGAIAWLRRVPTIFDIFISLHETIAGD
ncbi:MAG: hypothetical protein ACXVRK_15700, partial [Gaiellaceae bacterium]